MKRKVTSILLATLIIAQVFGFGVWMKPEKAKAAIIDLTQANCGMSLLSNNTYRLIEDMVCPNAVALNINSNRINIVLDGNGHFLKGADYYTTGISIYSDFNTSGITIQNFSEISHFGTAIRLNDANDNISVRDNIFDSNVVALFFNGYSGANFADNMFSRNTRTMIGNNSGTFVGNELRYNKGNIRDVIDTNHFNPNEEVEMDPGNIEFDESVSGSRKKNVDEPINFSFSMFNLSDKSACNNCVATVTTSPSEDVSINKIGNVATGSFTPHKDGTYSLIAEVTDASGNISKRQFLFFVGSDGDFETATTKYYLRGTNPTKGQPRSFPNDYDLKAMSKAQPQGVEEWRCIEWVQNSTDEIPDFPFANLETADIHSWYYGSTGDMLFTSLTRFATNFDANNNSNVEDPIINSTGTYHFENNTIENVNWAMDFANSWNWLAVKHIGSGLKLVTFPDQANADSPSFVDFTYTYSARPAVKSISNEKVILLSATEPTDDPGNASIVVDGTGETDMVLDGYKRPFAGHTTTVTPTDATLKLTGLNGLTTIDSRKMDITPNTGSIDIDITTWNTSGDYSKEWVEIGTGVASALHEIGDLGPNAYYTVTTDGGWTHTGQANMDGEMTFTYDGGYSEHTFNLASDSVLPVVDAGLDKVVNAQFTQNGTASDASGIDKYQWMKVSGPGTVNFGTEKAENTTVSASIDGTYVLRLTATDNAGNEAYDEMTFTKDSVAPSLTISNPNPIAFTTIDSTLDITGSAVDARSGIESLTINGVPISNPASFSTTVSLSLGLNTITVVATDTVGNIKTTILNTTRIQVSVASTNDQDDAAADESNPSESDSNSSAPVSNTDSSGNASDTSTESSSDTLISPITSIAKIVDSALAEESSAVVIDNNKDLNTLKILDGGKETILNANETPNFSTQTPSLKGKTEPFATVIIEIHSDPIVAEVVADKDGYWEYIPSGKLELGEHSVKITIKQKDTEKLISEQNYKFNIVEKTETQEETTEGSQFGDKKTNNNWLYLIAFLLLGIFGIVYLKKKYKSNK